MELIVLGHLIHNTFKFQIKHYYAHFISLESNFMSMGPWVAYRAGTWLIDERQIAFS